MQRDTHLRLGEIHDSPEALRRSIDDIIQTALVQVSEEEPLKLRFIIPSVPLEEWLEDERCVDYELTLPEAHESAMEYITVSYCWQHEQSTNGLPPTPDFQLRDQFKDKEASRPIRCPPLVFHRAMMYARHQKCPYVWIDQECIDQDNSADIERHLKIMHRVYKESHWTVAILSHTLQHDEVRTLKALLDPIHDHEDHSRQTTTPAPGTTTFTHYATMIGLAGEDTRRRQTEQVMRAIESAEIFKQIRNDRWFTRTWVLQERHCAQNLHLLVPVKDTLDAVEGDSNPMVGLDLLLDTLREETWRALSISAQVHEADEAKEIQQSKSTYHPERPGLLEDLRPHVWKGDGRPYFQEVFRQTELCDNLLVADRVSILGIIYGFPIRLLSNRLDDEKYSYSTCVLALFLVNHFPEQAQRREFLDGYGDSLLRWKMDTIIRLHFEDNRMYRIWF